MVILTKLRTEALRLYRLAVDRTRKPKPVRRFQDIHTLAIGLCPVPGNADLYFRWLMSLPEEDRNYIRIYAETDEPLIDDVEKRFDWRGFRDSELRVAAAACDYDPPHSVEYPVDFNSRWEAARGTVSCLPS